jgi:putative heme-binding domain-containing protein
LDGWTLKPPSLRQASIAVLIGRAKWAAELLDSIDRGEVNRSEIPLAARQGLLKEQDQAVKQHAARLWASDQSSSRAEVLARYKAATSAVGDAAKGATHFGALCAQCHLLHGIGHAVGPDLAALRDKSPEDFLTAILDPNAAVEPRFIAYNLETRDGRSLSGVVSAETSTSLTLTQPGGTQETILRSDIQEIRASGVSLMPEGLEQTLIPQDLADLIAFLKKPAAATVTATGK